MVQSKPTHDVQLHPLTGTYAGASMHVCSLRTVVAVVRTAAALAFVTAKATSESMARWSGLDFLVVGLEFGL